MSAEDRKDAGLGEGGGSKRPLRGALKHGVERYEIKDVLLLVAMYCGVPAAIEAVRCAREVFAEDAKPVG